MNKKIYDLSLKYSHPNEVRSFAQIALVIFLNLFMLFLISYVRGKAGLIFHIMMIPCVLLFSLILFRSFILLHDLMHDSLFKNKKLNKVFGRFLSVILFIPYEFWKNNHLNHHVNLGNLDESREGYIPLVTTDEFKKMNTLQKIIFLSSRNAIMSFLFFGFVYFVIILRYPKWNRNKYKSDLIFTNLLLVLSMAFIVSVFGLETYLFYLTSGFIAAGIGYFVFLVQHNFERVRYDSSEGWNFYKNAFSSTSFLKVPTLLKWFSADVGYHHVHHLNMKIPNYYLESCHYELKLNQNIVTLEWNEIFKSIKYILWDNEKKKMITYNEFKSDYNYSLFMSGMRFV